jgi:multifunctional 2-oxoglutarate metabolism enzyme
MVSVTLPEMGESVTEGSIVEWRKNVGDYVSEGDALVDVTTDKVDVEVPATASGTITQIHGGAGDTIAVGAVLAEIDTSKVLGNGAAPAKAAASASPFSAEPKIVEVTLPEMGESVTEGSIVELQKKVGDFVREGDTLLDVTTDKVDVEVPAPTSGAIVAIFVKPGDTVAVGAKLVEIDANAAGASDAPAAPAAAAKTASAASKTPPQRASGEVVASQPAQRMASRLDVDLALVRGSGPNGMIMRGDVTGQAGVAHRTAPPSAAPSNVPPLPPVPAGATVTPLRGPAATLTGYMEQSLTIPTATSFRTLLVDVLDARRRELMGALKAAARPEKVSFTHVIAYALVRAVHHLFVPAR